MDEQTIIPNLEAQFHNEEFIWAIKPYLWAVCEANEFDQYWTLAMTISKLFLCVCFVSFFYFFFKNRHVNVIWGTKAFEGDDLLQFEVMSSKTVDELISLRDDIWAI